MPGRRLDMPGRHLESRPGLSKSIHISQSRPRISKSMHISQSQSREFKSIPTSQSLPRVSKSIGITLVSSESIYVSLYKSVPSACIYVY